MNASSHFGDRLEPDRDGCSAVEPPHYKGRHRYHYYYSQDHCAFFRVTMYPLVIMIVLYCHGHLPWLFSPPRNTEKGFRHFDQNQCAARNLRIFGSFCPRALCCTAARCSPAAPFCVMWDKTETSTYFAIDQFYRPAPRLGIAGVPPREPRGGSDRFHLLLPDHWHECAGLECGANLARSGKEHLCQHALSRMRANSSGRAGKGNGSRQ
jgi:hypothetical protein